MKHVAQYQSGRKVAYTAEFTQDGQGVRFTGQGKQVTVPHALVMSLARGESLSALLSPDLPPGLKVWTETL